MQQYGYGGSPFTAGASNPDMVRRQIGQDLAPYGQAPLRQQAVPYGTIPAQPGYGANFGQSTLAQFGTNPQAVRQQLGQSWGYPGPANTAAPVPGYQPIQNQGYYNPAAFQQVMNAGQTDPQWVRQQIQQDIQAGAQPPAHLTQQPQAYQAFTGQGQSALSQFGTNPQMVQSQIRNQWNQQPQPQPTQAAYQPQGTGVLNQFGTNPQMVRQQIQSDWQGPQQSGYFY